MAVSSYLSDVAGGMVVAASFDDEASASAALDLLAGSGVRPQDTSVVARDARLAARLAGSRAWTPGRDRRGPRLLRGDGVPRELKRRYADRLRSGAIVIVAAADGQPPDTLAALLAQAKAVDVEQWWQEPAGLFAPPELAGPF